jgi:hypothetical protein
MSEPPHATPEIYSGDYKHYRIGNGKLQGKKIGYNNSLMDFTTITTS